MKLGPELKSGPQTEIALAERHEGRKGKKVLARRWWG
jgi:hypothetical protein